MDLTESSEIPLTKQVNDIASISDRQANFSKQLKLENTANNVRGLEYLPVVGSTTDIPYRQNKALLLNADSGEFIIYNGWAVILSSDDKYTTIAIYDGVIDFYKAISNKSMSEMDLTEIDHFRTIHTISDSINNLLPYKYIIADYNGGATIEGQANINADYLIPAVNVEWLWNKIFETFGFTYTGEIFNLPAFKDLWLTYPKGTTVGLDVVVPLLDVTQADILSYTEGQQLIKLDLVNYLLTQGSLQLDPQNYEYFICPQDGQILITNINSLTGTYIRLAGENPNDPAFDMIDLKQRLVVEHRDTNTLYTLNQGQSMYIPVNEGDELYFYVGVRYNAQYGGWPDYVFDSAAFKLELYQGEKIDFKGAFEKLLIKDFISEVLWLLNLTPFKNRYTNNIHFMTFEERVLTAEVEDWSDKFNKQVSEKYVLSNYGKLNYLKHKYNASNADYNDSAFVIENVNLKDSADVIRSKFYTNEFESEFILDGNKKLKKYKLWEKEANDKPGEPPYKYKALDNRFYFIKYTDTVLTSPVTIESEALGDQAVFSNLPLERNTGLTYKEVQANSYKKLGYILNKIKLSTIEVYLTRDDFANIDFTKKIYFEQLGGQFLLNKVPNFVPNKMTKIEALKIDLADLISSENGDNGGGTGGPTILTEDIVLEAVVPQEYVFDITSHLYLGVILGPGETIEQIEFQGYSGNLFTDSYGDDIAQGAGVLQYGLNLFLHALNIDNTFDYLATNPRVFTYTYHVYINNGTSLVHKYTVVKNFTINYSEAWGFTLNLNVSNGGWDTQFIENDLKLNAPLLPGEQFLKIIPYDFFEGPATTSEFWAANIEAMELGVDQFFGSPLVLEPHKVDGSYIPPNGTVLELRLEYELWALNTNTNTPRAIHICYAQVFLTYN